MTANECTEVVFRADNTGCSGLGEASEKHGFTWQQHGMVLTVTYTGEVTRFKGGNYQMKFVPVSRRQGAPTFVRLELTNKPGNTDFLEGRVQQ
jgi:hypothetical protein